MGRKIIIGTVIGSVKAKLINIVEIDNKNNDFNIYQNY